MSILIVGADGNMGKRYARILDYLGKSWTGVDVGTSPEEIEARGKEAHGYILATPTDTHLELIEKYSLSGKPILCEKPISKDLARMRTLFADLRKRQTDLTMVMQYSWLTRSRSIGWSYYNYFKHGNDGLVWDCIQIIGLARGRIDLEDDSPVWRCRINGHSLKIADMDAAYIRFIQDWLGSPSQSLDEIMEIHEKTNELAHSNTYSGR